MLAPVWMMWQAALLWFTLLQIRGVRAEDSQPKGGDSEIVKVWSLQRGTWTKPSPDAFLRYNFSRSAPSVSRFSVCYRIRLERYSDLSTHLSYMVAEDNFDVFGVYSIEDTLLTWFMGKSVTPTLEREVPTPPETWHHFCHVFSGDTYSLYWQGEKFYSSPMDPGWSMPMNGTIVIGQEQDLLGGGFDSTQVFMGDVAQVSVWQRILTPSEVSDFAKCKDPGRSDLFSSDMTRLEVFGSVILQEKDLNDLCKPSFHYYLMLPEMISFQAALSMCRTFNTTLAVPRSQADNNLLTKEMMPFYNICFPSTTWKVWIGITDEQEEGVWRDVNNNQTAQFLNFGSLYPLGTTVYNCVSLMINGFWRDQECKDTSKRCTACNVQ